MPSADLLLVTRSLKGAESLPPAIRADLYDSAAKVLAVHPEFQQQAEACVQAAHHLREAESAQLTLLAILA